MISKVLKVGDRIEMVKQQAAENTGLNQKMRTYNSQLLDIIDEKTVITAVPIEGGHLVPLEPGERYELRFITSAGIYICKSEITERNKKGNIAFFRVSILSELRKDQRRQYFRLDKIGPLKYHSLTREERELFDAINSDRFRDDYERRRAQNRLRDMKAAELEGTMANISGGGIKFFSDHPLESEDIVRLKLYLGDSDPEQMDLFARVVNSESVVNRQPSNEHRMEFVYITREMREKIVKFVFSEERKLRQKEKGLF